MANAPKSAKNSIELNDEAVAALVRFAKAKATIKRAETAKAKAEAKLREALNGNSFGLVNGIPVLSLVEATRNSLDSAIVEKNAPEVYKQALRSTTYDYLKALG
ncbi:MAG: hypothetical protein EBT15_09910 [Betaproteobacteria bacterium]|nr:hypothetical protein [Betaproteobacteria bacterium]